MAYVSSVFPTFLDGLTFAPARPDPPDFLEAREGKVGLEITSWLDSDQVHAATGRERMREDILGIVEEKKFPHPRNFCYVVITPQWGSRIKKSHYRGVREEFRNAIESIDGAWKSLRDGHWATLGPGERFDYLAQRDDLSSYPTLSKYISSIWFTEPARLDPASSEGRWINIEQDGGFYDPARTAGALRSAVQNKVDRYRAGDLRAGLETRGVRSLYLLVHTDPARFSTNTPYQTPEQLMASPVEGLPEVARLATEGLASGPRVFDEIFLLYHVWNAKWLAQIWPDFQRIPAADP
ncbi:MAG TPA: hypothetical protein VI386_21920 [Candidatus Sulfotelmatobacter sp.]